jgi:hypothetical protein
VTAVVRLRECSGASSIPDDRPNSAECAPQRIDAGLFSLLDDHFFVFHVAGVAFGQGGVPRLTRTRLDVRY